MALDNPITTTLHYLKLDPKWNDEKPFTLFVDVSDIQGAQNTNIVKEAVPGISVHDARPSLDGNDRLTLDINGFEMIHLRQDDSPDDFENPKWVEDHYYPYLCRLLKGRLGAKEARVYEHKVYLPMFRLTSPRKVSTVFHRNLTPFLIVALPSSWLW